MRKVLVSVPEVKEKRSRGILSGGLRRPWLLRLFAAWALGPVALLANPTGGSVAAGSASIASAGNTLTVNQASDRAVINWGTFSIASGETTKFVQPSSTSAALNRVVGGQTSLINGTLTANGQVYLVNGNGIVIGPGGMVNAAAFTASTRDIADADFLSGHLHFSGSGNGGVQNLGTIMALGGDVVLIGKTVDNRGTIQAPQGTAGLVAADDVLLAQRNADGSTITVNPSPTASSAAGRIGVHNSGSIAAASAELKAANGNIYALAIQNEGTIRATTAQRQGGRIWLKSDQGTVVNTASGVLDASAAQAGGNGGQIETSGEQLGIAGAVTAGEGGSWLLDPINVDIDSTAAATLVSSLNSGTSATVQAFGGTADTGIIDVLSAITWSGHGTLSLTATGDINIGADVTSTGGEFHASADSDGNGAGNINIGAGVTVNTAHRATVFSGADFVIDPTAHLTGGSYSFLTTNNRSLGLGTGAGDANLSSAELATMTGNGQVSATGNGVTVQGVQAADVAHISNLAFAGGSGGVDFQDSLTVPNVLQASGSVITVEGTLATAVPSGIFFTTDAVAWGASGLIDLAGTGDFNLTTLTKGIFLTSGSGTGTGTFDINDAFLARLSNYGELDLTSSATGDAIVIDGAGLSGKVLGLDTTAGNIHFMGGASTFGSINSTRSSATAGDLIVDAAVATDAGGIDFDTDNGTASSYHINASMTSAGSLRLASRGAIQVAASVALTSATTMLVAADVNGTGAGDLTLGAGSAVTITGAGQLMFLGGNNVNIDPTAVINAGAAGTLNLVYEGSVGIGTTDGTSQITAANLANMTFQSLNVTSSAQGNAIFVGDLNNTATPTANGLDWTTGNLTLNAVSGTVGGSGNIVFENVDPLSFGTLNAYAYNDIVFSGGGYAGGAGLLNLNADYDSTGVGSLRVGGSTVSNGGAQFVVVAAAVDDLGALDNAGQPISIRYTQNLHLTTPPPVQRTGALTSTAAPSAPVVSTPIVNQPFNSFSQFSAQTQAPSVQTVSSTTTSSTTAPSFSSSFNSVIPSVRPGGGAPPPVFLMQANNAPTDDDGNGVLAFGSSYRRGQGQ